MKKKSWLKVVYSLGTLVMLAPNFITAGTVVAETIDQAPTTASSSVESGASDQGQDEQTASSVSAEKVQDAEEKVAEQQEVATPKTEEATTKEVGKSVEAEKSAPVAEGRAETTKATITEEQLAALKVKLPKGSEVTFTNNKLTVKLPAGVEPEVGKKAVQNLGLQKLAEVEVQAKKATIDVNSDSYKYGMQLAHGDWQNMLRAGATVGKGYPDTFSTMLAILNGTLPEVNSVKAIGASFAADLSITDQGKPYHKEYNLLGGFTGYAYKDSPNPVINRTMYIDRNNLVAGYNEYIKRFRAELQKYFENLHSSYDVSDVQVGKASLSKNYQNAKLLTDLKNYDPNALTATQGKTVNDIKNLTKMNGYSSAPGWNYTKSTNLTGTAVTTVPMPGDSITIAQDILGAKDKNQTSDFSGGIGLFQSSMSLVLGQIESIIERKMYEDPRGLGLGINPEDISFPKNFTEALVTYPELNNVINILNLQDIVGSPEFARVYGTMITAMRSVLIEEGMKGASDGWVYVLNQDATLKSATKYSYSTESTGQNPTAIALSSGFKLAEKYGMEVKKQALADALKLDEPVDKAGLFSTLNNKSGSVFNNENRLNDDQNGDTAKTILFTLYQQEFKAVKKAIADYQASPFENPTKTNPSYKTKNAYDSTKEVEVKDYYNVRVWLYFAGQSAMKQGIADVDETAHNLFSNPNYNSLKDITDFVGSDAFKMTADKIPTAQLTISSTDIANANAKTPNSGLDAFQNDLVKIAQNAYMYGYNGEIKQLLQAYEYGRKDFFDQANLMYGTSSYYYYGPAGLTAVPYKNNQGLAIQTINGREMIFDKTSVTDSNDYTSVAVVSKDYRGRAYLDALARTSADKAVRVKVNFREVDYKGNVINSNITSKFPDTYLGFATGALADWTRQTTMNDDGSIDLMANVPELLGYEPLASNVTPQYGSYNINAHLNSPEITKINEGYDDLVPLLQEQYKKEHGSLDGFPIGSKNPYFDPKLYKLVDPFNIDFVKVQTPQLVEPLSAIQLPNGQVRVTGKVDMPGSRIALFHNGYVPGTASTTLDKIVADKDGNFTYDIPSGNVDVNQKVSLTPKYVYPSGKITTGTEKQIPIVIDHPTKIAYNAEMTDTAIKNSPTDWYVGVDYKNIKFFYSDEDGDKLKFKISKGTETGYQLIQTISKDSTDKTGFYNVTIPGEQITEGANTFMIEAFRVNADGSETEQTDAKLLYGIKGRVGVVNFEVNVDGQTPDTLSWTNRLLQPGAHTYLRDEGNNINVKVTDTRNQKDQGQWSIGVSAEAENPAGYKFIWGTDTSKVIGTDQTPVLLPSEMDHSGNGTDSVSYTKTFDKSQGVLLYSDKTIPIGEYTTDNGKSSAITWTLNDTYKPD